MTETKRPFKLFFTFLVVLICILLLAVGLRSILNSTIATGSAQIPTVTPTSFPTEITDAKGVTMRLVPAGDFIMGRDKGLDQEMPAHTVTLDDFYMDVYEVTQARYKECVNSGVCSEPKDVPNIDSFYQEPDHPMTIVDWYQSQTYCEWRGARLPTEAEWEKAARAAGRRVGREVIARLVRHQQLADFGVSSTMRMWSLASMAVGSSSGSARWALFCIAVLQAVCLQPGDAIWPGTAIRQAPVADSLAGSAFQHRVRCV